MTGRKYVATARGLSMDEQGDRTANTRARFSVEFEAADILIMADALSIGSTTAMMCGGGEATKRLRQLANQFKAMSPLPKSNSHSETYAWFDACRTVKGASWFEAFATDTGRSYDKDKRHIDVDIDGKVFRVCENVPSDEAEAALPAINDFLTEVAGMDTHRLVRTKTKVLLPDACESRWGNDFLVSVREAVAAALVGHGGLVCAVRSAEYCYGEEAPMANVTIATPAHEQSRILEILSELEASRSPSP